MDAISLRAEFVYLAQQAGSNIRELCRRYPISSRTAYKWLKRYALDVYFCSCNVRQIDLSNPSP
jgi:transposase